MEIAVYSTWVPNLFGVSAIFPTPIFAPGRFRRNPMNQLARSPDGGGPPARPAGSRDDAPNSAYFTNHPNV